MATTTSAARTTRPFRSSPRPVGIATCTHSLATLRSLPGRIPIVMPPPSRAPRHAAAITPPRPPQTMCAPALAKPRPIVSADCISCSAATLAPTIATYGGCIASADDDVHELVGHDHNLDDLVPVQMRLDPAGLERQRFQDLARGTGGRGDAVADLAIDLADELEGVGLEHRGIGIRPRLLPHAAPGQELVD